MCHISQTFSGSQLKSAGNMHKLRSRTGLSLNYAVEIPMCSAKNWDTVCTRIKNENPDNLIVLKIDIWKTKYCQLYVSFIFRTPLCTNFSTKPIWPKVSLKCFLGDFGAWIHVRVCQFVRVLFHLYAIHAQSCVIGNSVKVLSDRPSPPTDYRFFSQGWLHQILCWFRGPDRSYRVPKRKQNPKWRPSVQKNFHDRMC